MHPTPGLDCSGLKECLGDVKGLAGVPLLPGQWDRQTKQHKGKSGKEIQWNVNSGCLSVEARQETQFSSLYFFTVSKQDIVFDTMTNYSWMKEKGIHEKKKTKKPRPGSGERALLPHTAIC